MALDFPFWESDYPGGSCHTTQLEQETGTEFIHMEMGVPGLKAAQVGVDAEIEALRNGIASIYPNINGTPEVKKQASALSRRL